jgi:hypothetical protein
LAVPDNAARLVEAVGGPVGPVLDAARLAVTLRRTRAGHLERLQAELGGVAPLLFVPYLFTRSFGMRATRTVADALSDELGY